MPDSIAHYASQYYDPVKAHEYYERTKKLKGRRTGTSLNDSGKEAKTYVRNRINAKRDQDLKNAESQSKRRIEERKKSAERETYDNIRKESEELGKKLDELISMTSKLDGPTLRANKKRILAVVNSLAAKNKQSRTKLISLYKTNKTKINTEEREKLTAEKKKIRSDATNTYNSEVEKIQGDSEFQSTKKKSNVSSGKSSGTSRKSSGTSRKSSGTSKKSSRKTSKKVTNKAYNARMEAGHKKAAENYARWQKERAALKNNNKKK